VDKGLVPVLFVANSTVLYGGILILSASFRYVHKGCPCIHMFRRCIPIIFIGYYLNDTVKMILCTDRNIIISQSGIIISFQPDRLTMVFVRIVSHLSISLGKNAHKRRPCNYNNYYIRSLFDILPVFRT